MAAEASFKTDTLSMSFGLIRSRPPARFGIPSTTMSASPLLSVLEPRIRIDEPSAPGSPLRLTATTPAIRPASELLRFTVGDLIKSLPFTETTEPETVAFF